MKGWRTIIRAIHAENRRKWTSFMNIKCDQNPFYTLNEDKDLTNRQLSNDLIFSNSSEMPETTAVQSFRIVRFDEHILRADPADPSKSD